MKAMILAAGRGERMRPLTDNTPKPLLQVGGKPLIEYHIESLAAAGITDLVINHAHLGKMIENAIGDGQRWGICIRYSAEAEALETGGGIRHALPLLGEKPFIVLNGDIWTDYDFCHLLRSPNSTAHLVLVPNPPHNPQGDFALIEDKVVNQKDLGYTFSGIGLYDPELFAAHAPGAFPLAPLLHEWAGEGRVTGELFQGTWVDAGTPERLAELDRMLQSASVTR